MPDWFYAMKKRNHLCVDCGKQDGYTLNNRALCYECRQKKNERMREKYRDEAYRKKTLQRNKEQREKYDKNRQCPRCGRQLPLSSKYKTCVECRLKKRRYQEEKNRANGHLPRCLFNGITHCARCGKEEVVEGQRVCPNCLETLRVNVSRL